MSAPTWAAVDDPTADLRRCDGIDLDYASPRGISLREAVARLLARAERTAMGCLIASTGADHYTEVKASGRRLGAHVAVVLLRGEEIPSGQLVRHRCDTPGCVESTHLEVGTPSQNNRDRRRTGPHSYSLRGVRRAGAVLTDDLVAQMRREARQGEQVKAIASRMGINYATARSAIRGEKWQHVSEPPVPCGYRWSKPSPLAAGEGMRQRARGLARDGASLRQIADELGCSRDTAWRWTQISDDREGRNSGRPAPIMRLRT